MMEFRINPDSITNELYNFVENGNGILTGSPGSGKSYEVNKLLKYLQEKEKTVLFLPIDKLISESDVDLQEELGLKTNLFEYISSEKHVSNSNKGIIIIDAFDAARSGKKRNFYIKLIRKIVAELSGEWNILVVVRLFDAQKSNELLNIFSVSPEIDQPIQIKILKTSKEIPCRHVVLPELNAEDLTHLFENHPILTKYSDSVNPRIRILLLNPFYISLILQLIQTEENTVKIKSVYSEVQLLDLYWNSRIERSQSGMNYEILLTELTNLMVTTHSLSVPISGMINFPTENSAYLLSSGILTTVGINKNKIAYTHNILFDYAVSRLVIDDKENGLINFISEDKSRIVLLKPSIRYYLSKIWYNDKNLFKKICLKLYKAPSSELPLIAKIMPTQILVREANSSNDVQFISSLYEKEAKYRDWLHATIFSSLISFEDDSEFPYPPNRKFWLSYFERVIQDSSNPHDFNVAGWLYKIQKIDNSPEIQNQIGKISRKMLSTCINLRKTDRNIDGFASHLPVTLVVKTYGTNPTQSKEILEKIFEIVNEDDFELSYLRAVAYDIKEIFPYDDEFISKFYALIFYRTEESTKQTELGTTAHFRLTSNRRQDFDGIRYHLGQESGALLDSNLKNGLKTLIRAINYGVCRMHILPYLQDGHSINERITEFTFNNKKSKFLEDFCYIWSDSHYHMHPEFEMLTQIKNKIIKLVESPDDESVLKAAINEYGDHAVVAVLWRDLIKIVSTNPKSFSLVLIDLICAKPLQIHSETINELAELIESSIKYLSDEEINLVVTRTVENFENIDDDDRKRYLRERRNYLLSKIPKKNLPSEELKSIAEDYRENRRAAPRKPVEISRAEVGFISEEDILEIKGVDSNSDEYKLVQPKISAIKIFNNQWINEKISEADALIILKSFIELYTIVENPEMNLSQKTIDYAWEELARSAKIISRGINDPNSELYDYSCKVLLRSATLSITQHKEVFTPDYDPLAWSPTPVTDAAEGLLHLYSLRDGDEIWSAIKKLSQNEDPVVRSIIAIDLIYIFDKKPKHFWNIIDTFIEVEDNYKIHELICISLNNAFRKKPDCVSDVKKRFETIWMKSEKLGTAGSKIIENNCFIGSVSYFAFVHETEWAKTFFENVIQRKSQYSAIRPRIVSLIIDQFFKTPIVFNSKYDEARSSVNGWLNKILHEVFDEIQSLPAKPQWTVDDKKRFENLYGVIEQFITRFFFIVDKKYNNIDDPDNLNQAIEKIFSLEKETIEFVLDSLLKSDVVLRGDEIQYMLGILDSCLSQDPEKVLELTVKTLKIGNRIGYSSDHLGKTEIQEFIDHLIADHRDILEGKDSMDNFTELLDSFVVGNSPESINYIMSLDLEFN